ncbi:MAG: DMT family transporter [Myxococcales bacterium]|nr:DMT family transporter [Myxococcales bacterium]
MPQLSTPSRLRAGPLLMMCAVASFTGMVACVKLVRIDLDAIEVMWWRSLIGVPLIALVAARGGSLRIHRRGLLLLRALFGFGAMGCYFTAAKGLSLADLSLISRSQPMIIAIIAPLLLGRAERPHRGTWLVMLVGLVGCAVLLAPGLSLGSTWGLWALGAASFAAIAHTIVRALGATERPAAVVFWFQVLVALFALVVLVTTRGALPPVPAQAHWLPLAGVGLFAVLGQWLMTRAYQVDQAARVAAASYVGPLWAALVDIALFATLPGWHALVGGSLIVGAGVALALRRPSG